MCKIEEGTEWKFNYTGDEQEFVVPCDGNYKLELWGAQGGSTGECTGGFGAYSLGEIYLVERQIFINVGGSGIGGLTWEVKNGGYNGGGRAGVNSDTNSYNASGGGATHIAYSSGELNSLVNKRDDIIIVAGGGGGTGYNSAYGCTSKSGSGGGFVGVCSEPRYAPSIKKYMQGCGGTQTRGGEQITENIITLPEEAKSNLGAFGSFGQGGSGTSPWCGAGAGFFGGTNNGYCLLYTSDAADDGYSVDLGGRRIIKKIFFKQKTAYEISEGLVGSEMCIRDREDLLKWQTYGFIHNNVDMTGAEAAKFLADTTRAVSYTHLTLPTMATV